MIHDWADLGTGDDRAARDHFLRAATRTWQGVQREAPPGCKVRFAEGVWIERHPPNWVVRWAEPSLRPLARSVAGCAPSGQSVHLGLPGLGLEAAQALIGQSHGVNLDGTEVRVGITRGHLLALVFSIPLDVPGQQGQLQTAVECLCEHALGEQVLDRWIVTIDVVRSARRSRLTVLSTPGDATAETHPLALLEQLVQIGIRAVSAALPESQLGVSVAGWTALDIEPDPSGLQGERLQAFTNSPEALKAAFEGLPFDSSRFTRGPEVMVWFAWSRSPWSARLAAREAAELTIREVAESEGGCALCGSGFGPTKDYLDVWVMPSVELLSSLRERLSERLGVPAELGFYDSEWARERI
jgi:hypothetical protein